MDLGLKLLHHVRGISLGAEDCVCALQHLLEGRYDVGERTPHAVLELIGDDPSGHRRPAHGVRVHPETNRLLARLRYVQIRRGHLAVTELSN